MKSNFSRAAASIDHLLDRMDILAEKKLILYDKKPSDQNETGFLEARSLEEIEDSFGKRIQVVCYRRGSSKIHLSNQTLQYHEFEQMMRGEYNLSASRYFTTLLKTNKPTLLYVPTIRPDLCEDMVIYLYPIFLPECRETAVLSFLIKEEAIVSAITEYMGALQGDLYIYDQMHNVIFETHTADKTLMPLEQVYRLRGIGVLSHSSFAVVRELSSTRSLTYVMTARNVDFYATANSDRIILIILIAVLLLSCLAFVVAIAQFNYHPIRTLAQEISGEDGAGQQANELEVIKMRFVQTMEEKEFLSLRLKNQNTIMLEQLCIKLIGGNVADKAELDYLAYCADFAFEYEYNAAIYILPPPAQTDWIDPCMDLCRIFQDSLLHTASGELLRERAVCMIINYHAAPEEKLSRQLEVAGKLYALLSAQIPGVTVGVGNAYENPLEIHDSYLEALSAALHLKCADSKKLFFYHSAFSRQSGPEVAHSIPPLTKSLLIESCRQGDQAMARRVFHEIAEQLEAGTNSLLLLRLQCADLVNAIIESLIPFDIKPDTKQLAALMTFQSFEEFYEGASLMIDSLCNDVKKRLRHSDMLIKKRLLDFIAGSYMLPSFSLQMTIDSQQMTKNKINAILKEDVGMGFAQYVSWLRMNTFRRLLIETDRNIQDLVLEIGYVDVSSFLRKFKKIEGITAGQFRTQHAPFAAND